jgi:hypothetical protein
VQSWRCGIPVYQGAHRRTEENRGEQRRTEENREGQRGAKVEQEGLIPITVHYSHA